MNANFVVGIQVRLGSSRLPAKCFLTLNDKPLIKHIYEDAKKYFDNVFLLIPHDEIDIFTSVLKLPNNAFITGSENDVLQRFKSLSDVYANHYIIRTTGDNPSFCWHGLNSIIKEENISDPNTLYSSRAITKTKLISSEWKGQNFDIFHSSLAKKAFTRPINSSFDKEHVVPSIAKVCETFFKIDLHRHFTKSDCNSIDNFEDYIALLRSDHAHR